MVVVRVPRLASPSPLPSSSLPPLLLRLPLVQIQPLSLSLMAIVVTAVEAGAGVVTAAEAGAGATEDAAEDAAMPIDTDGHNGTEDAGAPAAVDVK